MELVGIKEAARRAGVTDTTIRRYLKQEAIVRDESTFILTGVNVVDVTAVLKVAEERRPMRERRRHMRAQQETGRA